MVKVILMYTAQPLAGFNTWEQGSGQLNVAGAVAVAKLVRSDLLGLTPAVGSPLLTQARSQSADNYFFLCIFLGAGPGIESRDDNRHEPDHQVSEELWQGLCARRRRDRGKLFAEPEQQHVDQQPVAGKLPDEKRRHADGSGRSFLSHRHHAWRRHHDY